MRDLVDVYVCVRETMHKFVRLGVSDVRKHHQQCRVLHHVGWHADREVARALEHVERKFVVYDAQVYPAVAGRYDHFLLFARAAGYVLRDPRRYKMRAQVWELNHLLDNIFDLVVRAAVLSREVVERRTIGARPQIAWLEPAFGRLLRRTPRGPKFAAKTL